MPAARKTIIPARQKAAIVAALIKKVCQVINCVNEMKTPNRERELVLLSKKALQSDEALDKELTCLEDLLDFAESFSAFYLTHELAMRNGITSKRIRLEKIFRYNVLKPFEFLVCKN